MKHFINETANTPVVWKSDIKSKELKAQDIKSLAYDINNNNFEIKTNKEQDYNIFFKFDESNIGVKISENNINRLKDFFKEDNFIETKKGIILDKDAAAFVAGWFSDIAYKQNLLAADKNNDGEIRGKENKYTLNNFNEILVRSIDPKTKEEIMVSVAIIGTYLPNIFDTPGSLTTSISDVLDKTLDDDKNLDGIVTFKEYLNIGDKDYDHIYLAGNISKKNDDSSLRTFTVKTKDIDELREKELEELKKLAALEKLKNKGLEALSNDEKKLLKDLSINAKELSEKLKINEDKLKDLINNNKLADFVNFSQDFIKTLSETKLIDIRV